MKKTLAIVTLLSLVGVAELTSHDFWLIPNAFHISAGGELVVHGQTSSDFPTSLSAVTVDRVATARVIGARGEETIEDLGVSGPSLRLVHRPRHQGQALVAVTIHPRNIPESPESFRRYLELEGAPEILARYEAEGILPTDDLTRRYAKYAKALVHVGQGGPTAFDRRTGLPFEFIPVTDPETVGAGGSLRFRALLFGEPLAHARGHASAVRAADSEGPFTSEEFETDELGEFELAVTDAGIWNVRALYILPAPAGTGADWDVHWTTFVWEVDS